MSIVQVAEAEPTRTISGYDANREIFIADNGISNIIILQSDTGVSKHFDAKVKTYNSGGFSMKNHKSGIIVFGHPISDNQYKLLVLTSNNVYRFIGISGIIEELNEEPITSEEEIVEPITSEEEIESGIIEPSSSVGADITKYDVPDTLSRDGELSFLMTFKPLTFLDSIYLNDKFELKGYVYDVRDASRIDADLTLEISRDDYILNSVKQSTGTFGTVDIEIDDMIYPLYYPNFCYDVKLTMEYGNYTSVWTDDFVIRDADAWNPNMNWVIDARWNYLPQSFRDEPRQSIIEDERCN
jgi:hypothetical protein